MSVARVYQMTAAEGKGDLLDAALGALGPLIVCQPGCLGAEVLQDIDDPNSFVLIEKWETIGHHQAAIQNLPQESLSRLMSVLAEPLEGRYMNAIQD